MTNDATERFSQLAEIYARCRPDYPSAAIDFILQKCNLQSGYAVVDIGAGTGIFTRLLAERGLAVVGIEPNSKMRAQAEAAQVLGSAAIPEYRDGTGEATGLPTESVRVVFCAQAFHWLQADKALAEFHRILVPGGWTALIWNERDEGDVFTAAYGNVIRSFPGAAEAESARQGAGQALLGCSLFHDAGVTHFEHSQLLDEEGSIGRAFSASYAPSEPAQRELLKRDLHSVFQRFAEANRVTMRYTTSVYLARRPL